MDSLSGTMVYTVLPVSISVTVDNYRLDLESTSAQTHENGTSETDDQKFLDDDLIIEYPPAVEIINYMGVIFASLSILLNVLFLCCHCVLKKQKPSAHRMFMTNLSVSDVMTALSFLIIQYWPRGPFANIDMNPDFYLVPALPYVFRSLPWLFFTSYLLTLNCLTINQWIAVCRPWRYSALVTTPRIRISLSFVWAIASLQVIVPLTVLILLSSLKDRQDAKQKLWTVPQIEMQAWMVFYGLSTVFNIILNIVVYRKISKLKRMRRGARSSNSGMSNIKKKQRAFVTIIMLLVASLVCRIPFPVFGIIGVALHTMSMNLYIIGNAGVIFLLHLNCLIDPIIYISRTKDVRIAGKTVFLKLTSCGSCCCTNLSNQGDLSMDMMGGGEIISSNDRVSLKAYPDTSIMNSNL